MKNNLFTAENKFVSVEKEIVSKMSGARGAVSRYCFAAILPSAMLTAVLFFGSCSEVVPLESNVSSTAQGQLAVVTRSTNGTVSYPVNVYVFGSTSGSCVKTATLASSSDNLSIYLPVGSYSVQAIGGASSDDYVLPTVDNATAKSPITLRDGHNHGDLMTAAQALVKIGEGEENSLSLSMTRKVMQLCNVTMNNVPSGVTAVSVSISPLYNTLLLNGTYTGSTGSFTANLTKGDDGTTWSLTSDKYLLEANGKAAITVSMTTADGTKTYSYESSDALKANYKINITGTYKVSGFTVSGTITGTEWAGTHNITFDMTDEQEETGSEDKDDKGDKSDASETTTATAPEVGSIYMKKCLVVHNDTDKVTGSVTSTLMTVKEKGGLTTAESLTQSEWKNLTDAGLAELAVDGVTGWRLPTEEELKWAIEYVDANGKAAATALVKAGGTNLGVNGGYWFFKDDSGNIKELGKNNGYKSLAPEASTLLRGFTTVTFTK